MTEWDRKSKNKKRSIYACYEKQSGARKYKSDNQKQLNFEMKSNQAQENSKANIKYNRTDETKPQTSIGRRIGDVE